MKKQTEVLDCIPNEPGSCAQPDRTDAVDSERVEALRNRLREILKKQNAAASDIDGFAAMIAKREDRARRWKEQLQAAAWSKTDILFWISEAKNSGDRDEVLWRAFLAGHFGRASADSEAKDSAAKLLCAFDTHPFWTWVRVSSNRDSFREWLREHRDLVKSLRYGNHRKYEATKPMILYGVFSSFVCWVEERGGSPEAAFQGRTNATPEDNFAELYHALKLIRRFGRTGAFDLLCLLGDMGLLSVRPDSCHVHGSTGPLRGARKLWGERTPVELSRLADQTAKALGIPYDVFEDALCMWQK